MSPRLTALLALTLSVTCAAADTGMTALNEAELSSVSGQEGVMISLNFRNNLNADNSPKGCTVVDNTPNPCRLGFEFANRAGTWLMLKEFYGTFQIKEIRMDAGTLPAATSYANPDRFKDGAGVCIIAGCNPSGKPTVIFSYPGADARGTYDDFLSFLNIGRVWLENDTDVEPAGTRGFQRDTTPNSMLGVRMSDSSALNAPAKMRFRGTGYVYGF